MVSAAEQLAANLKFDTFKKAGELQQRLLFTLGALLVYRLGTFIPIPGIDTSILNKLFENSNSVFGLLNVFSGGALSRSAIFLLNIMPYITASIIIQLLTSVLPTLEALRKEGESGRKQLNQYTRYLTVVIATVQATLTARGLNSSALEPGWFFQLTTVISLVGGTMFLVWLGEQITARGIGNGSSLIIFAGIVAEMPTALARILEQGKNGILPPAVIIVLLLVMAAVITMVVYFERAQRRLTIQYPKRQIGNRMFQGDSSHLPLKLNASGVIPPIFASTLLYLPATAQQFIGSTSDEVSRIACAAWAGTAAPRPALYRADRFLLLLLHADCHSSAGNRGQSQEVWRLHTRLPARSKDSAIYRICAKQDHGDWRGLRLGCVHTARDSILPDECAILFWRNIASDRC